MENSSRRKPVRHITVLVEKPHGTESVTIYTIEAAFHRLIQLDANQRPRLLKVAKKWTWNDIDAEDAVQGALMRAYLHLKDPRVSMCLFHMPWGPVWMGKRFSKLEEMTRQLADWFRDKENCSSVQEITSPVAWLHTIVANEAKTRVRRTMLYRAFCETLPEESLEDDIRFEDPEAAFLREERAEEVRGWVRELPAMYRDVVELRFFEEKSLREIAEEVQRPFYTVKSQEQRALVRLKQRIEGERNPKNGKLLRKRTGHVQVEG